MNISYEYTAQIFTELQGIRYIIQSFDHKTISKHV